MHIVLAVCDTEQVATPGDRLRLYVNGDRSNGSVGGDTDRFNLLLDHDLGFYVASVEIKLLDWKTK